LFDGVHLWYALPSGRILCYPFAKLEEDGVTYAKAAWKPAADAKEWPRARLWRGLACENVTQATANDILRYALRSLDADGFEPVLHVNDEIVLETTVAAAFSLTVQVLLESAIVGVSFTAVIDRVMVRLAVWTDAASAFSP
jgi:hypothetical protein